MTNSKNIVDSSAIQTVVVSFTCLKSGNNSFKLEVYTSSYDPLFLYMFKVCSWPMLMAGTSIDSSLISDGEVVVANYETDTETSWERFYIWLDSLNRYNGQVFRYSLITYDLNLLNPILTLEGVPAAYKSLPGAKLSSIKIDYNCRLQGSSLLNLTLDVGWTTNLTLTWGKACIQPSSGSNSWSALAIFAFVFFMLIFIFCIASCAFNYVQRGRTGWNVVPGVGLYRRCYDKIVQPPARGPQTDYHVVDSSAGYGTYQNDL